MIAWAEAWYPVAGGVLWLRPADVLAVAPGDGPTPAARLAAGRLPRAEAHGASWRAVVPPRQRRKPAGALLAEALRGSRADAPARRAYALGSAEDGSSWEWPADALAAWRWAAHARGAGGRSGCGLGTLADCPPSVEPVCRPLRGPELRAFAAGLRAADGGPPPAALASRLAEDAEAGGCAGRARPRGSALSRAGWGAPC